MLFRINMPSTYTINDLERLTGIKAHTIRIWEQRYALFSPERTEANIRHYGDEDLRKILNVNTLLKEGWKISKISALNPQDLEAQVWDTAKATKTPEQEYDIYVQAMIAAAMSFDEEWFDSVYADVTRAYGVPQGMKLVIGPFLQRMGLMWTVLKVHPGQEHFASNLIRRKLLAEIDRLPKPGSKGKYLLFLPPWEEHEIGLIFAWYLLKSAGYDVIYLGQRVPMEALVQSIGAVTPSALLTFFVAEQTPDELQHFADTVNDAATGIPFYAATRQDLMAGIHMPKGIEVLDSPEALLDII